MNFVFYDFSANEEIPISIQKLTKLIPKNDFFKLRDDFSAFQNILNFSVLFLNTFNKRFIKQAKYSTENSQSPSLNPPSGRSVRDSGLRWQRLRSRGESGEGWKDDPRGAAWSEICGISYTVMEGRPGSLAAAWCSLGSDVRYIIYSHRVRCRHSIAEPRLGWRSLHNAI
jgi:hypothetical protein